MAKEIKEVQKRDGTIVDFDQERITQAILKALTATNSGGKKLAKQLSDKVVFLLKRRFKENEIPKIEEIQDIVEEVLILEGLVEAAKAYILYREQRRKIRETAASFDEAVDLVDRYIKEKDWQVKENANMSYSLQGLNHYVTSAVTKKYWLEKIYPKEIREAARDGDFHIHDLDALSPYCCGWDLYDLLIKGFGGVRGKVECKPARHLRSALGQAVNFLYTLQGECYSADTQVLTESGWKYFYEVTPNDKIFTLNPSTNEIQLQKPIRFYKFDWNGELYHFHSKKLDLLVTPNHRMLVDQYCPNCRKKYHRKFIEARNFKASEHFIPKSGGIWKGKKENIHYLYSIEKEIKEPVLALSKETIISNENFLLPQIETSRYRNFGKKYETIKIEAKKIPLKDWLAFFGFWLAEGNISQRKRTRKGRTKPYYEYAIRITQNIGKTASEFETVLKRLPFSYLKKQNGKKLEFVIYNKQLFSYLQQFGKAEEKFIPQEIKELDKEYLEILFEWMMKGDGYQGNGNIQYYTKSKRLADDLQEIILKLGYSANIYEKQKAGKFSWYVVSVSKRKHFKFRKENIKKVFYKGKVYCLEVPNHTLYVRRNGKACWCGNSAGAQAFNSLDTLLAPFIRYDNLTYQQVKQCLQEFIFNCAVPTRVGFQSLCWDEVVVVKNKGKIKFIEIGKLIDKYFEKYPHQIIEQHPQSYAIPNFEDWEVLSFNKEGKAIWKKVKAFIRHKVPKNSEFVEIKTNRGSARVSIAHSLFAFKKLNGKFNPIPKSALEVEKASPNYQINENNHFLALSSKEKENQKNYLDLLEILEDLSENFLKNVFVKINPSKTISKIKNEILKEYQSFLPFWKEFGFKDRGLWREWLKNKSVRFDVWKRFFKPKPREIYLQLKNSKRWYPRIIKGNLLKDFVKLCAYYITEGHSQISTCLFTSQAKGKNFKEIVKTLKNLNSLGKIYPQKGFSQKGNKTKKVYKITGDGLLAEIIARSCGYLSFNKVIPWFIFNLKEEYQKIFIETLLKGDGAEFDNYWDISTTSKKLASGLSLLLAQNGFRFSVYFQKVSKRNKNWRDQYVIRIFKNKNSKKTYKVDDFEARICLGIEKFKYQNEYEYDISVDLEEENFVGGAGLLVFHNTPFTNITLDLKVPKHMESQPVIIGGKPQKETYGEFQEEMNLFNKAFYEVMCEGDAKGRVFSFPIPTINISKDFDWDNPAYEGVWKASAKYGLNYFANFINSDMDPEDARSMCPLGGNEKVLIKSSRNRGLEFSSIRNIYEGHSKQTTYWIYSDGKFVKGRFNKFPNQKMIKVTLINNHEIIMSENHLNFVLKDKSSKIQVLKGKELKEGMYLPYSLTPYQGKGGNRELGFLVGAYAGDGSFDGDSAVVFSLSKDKQKVAEKIKKIVEKYFGAHTSLLSHPKTKLLTLRVNSKSLVGLCKEFVIGKEREKCYSPRVFEMSSEFRKGVLEGHLATDGSRQRIYTSSKKMVETLNMLAATLGTTTSIYKDERDNRLGKAPNYAVLIYRLNRKELKDFWFKKYGKLWIKIKSIQPQGKASAYCFEVEGDKPIFTVGTTGILTHNCRLRLDNRELYKRGGGLFGSWPKTGSIGVVTINLPRIGYLSKTKKEFFQRLKEMMDLAKESLDIKRKTLENFMEKGLYPYSKYYLSDIKKMRNSYFGNHFSTIGLIGMNEALLNFLGEDIGTKRGLKFAIEVLDFMRERLVKYQKETDYLYNLEATPAEGTSYRLARIDKEKYPDIITAGTKKPYYTNSTQLPVNKYTDDLFEALKLQDPLQTRYTGGTVFHIFLGERIADHWMVPRLIKKIFERFKLPYITITPTFSICPVHGYLPGEHFFCPKCTVKTPCEVYSRVVGYLRPVQSWNEGKQEEFRQRKEFKLPRSI